MELDLQPTEVEVLVEWWSMARTLLVAASLMGRDLVLVALLVQSVLVVSSLKFEYNGNISTRFFHETIVFQLRRKATFNHSTPSMIYQRSKL